MDVRSARLNFEITALLYDKAVTRQLAESIAGTATCPADPGARGLQWSLPTQCARAWRGCSRRCCESPQIARIPQIGSGTWIIGG